MTSKIGSERQVSVYPKISGLNINNLQSCIEHVTIYNTYPVWNKNILNRKQALEVLKDGLSTIPSEYIKGMVNPLRIEIRAKAEHDELSEKEVDAVRAVFFHTTACTDPPGSVPKKRYRDWEKVCKATKAAQEVVSDLFNEIVEHQGQKIKDPKKRPLAPLHTWSTQSGGSYVRIVSMRKIDNLKAAIVNFPIGFSHGGILAWAALAHEAAGRDIIDARIGLTEELEGHIKVALLKEESFKVSLAKPPRETVQLKEHLVSYWTSRIEETTSDVLGFLSLGPAGAIGLIGYFKGVFGKLRTEVEDPAHLHDLLRGLLATEVIAKLKLKNAKQWAKAIRQQTLFDYPRNHDLPVDDRDEVGFSPINLGGVPIAYNYVISSVEIVAHAILYTPLKVLKGLHLMRVRAWSKKDESIVAKIRPMLKGLKPLPPIYPSLNPAGYYGAHVIAASTLESLSLGADIQTIFARTITILGRMNSYNPAWHLLECRAHLMPYDWEGEDRAADRSETISSSSFSTNSKWTSDFPQIKEAKKRQRSMRGSHALLLKSRDLPQKVSESISVKSFPSSSLSGEKEGLIADGSGRTGRLPSILEEDLYRSRSNSLESPVLFHLQPSLQTHSTRPATPFSNFSSSHRTYQEDQERGASSTPVREKVQYKKRTPPSTEKSDQDSCAIL